MNRRELLKLVPVVAVGAFAIPKFRQPLLDGKFDWVWGEMEQRGIAAMVLFHHEYMHLADKVAERYPGLKLVLDHIGLKSGKDVTEANNFATLDNVLALAKRPNVAAKVSAMPCYAADKTYPFRSVHPHIRRVFDLAADPAAIGAHLARDPTLAPLVTVRPGLRVPGAWDGFELAIRAILGQQITVTAARALAGKLVQAYGEPLAHDLGGAAEGLTHVFPAPARLAGADFAALGMPKSRAIALAAMTAAVACFLVVQLLGQHLVLDHEAGGTVTFHDDYTRIAAALAARGVRPPCLISGVQYIPIAFYAGCASAGNAAPGTRVALLVQSGRRAPSYARTWAVYHITGTAVLKVSAYIRR